MWLKETRATHSVINRATLITIIQVKIKQREARKKGKGKTEGERQKEKTEGEWLEEIDKQISQA